VGFQYPGSISGLVAEYSISVRQDDSIRAGSFWRWTPGLNTFSSGLVRLRTRPVTAFGHYLIGTANTRVGYDNGKRENSIGMTVGGGLDVNVTKNFASGRASF
jgi:opacity protein-like surface antigen